MSTALFINGVYEEVFREIASAQAKNEVGEFFLQPHKGAAITMLRDSIPSHAKPVRFYASVTSNPESVAYTGEIVGWEDKRSLVASRRAIIERLLRKFQEKEVDLFNGDEAAGDKPVNLLTVREVRPLIPAIPRSRFLKCSDGKPYSRPRPGGWSQVHDPLDFTLAGQESKTEMEAQLESAVRGALALPLRELERLADHASRIPERVEIVSVGYRRSPYVMAAVLLRAQGQCERCREPAPFVRRSDGTPYLEVHHLTQLSEGGEDTISNATALCPNCHRELHHA